MNVTCSAQGCPIILNSLCVIYEGESLLYTGITTNDTLETALQKIDAKFHDAGLGYIFTNGLSQTVGQPVKLGGSLIENTTITNNSFYLQFTGTVKAASFVTTGGTSSQFVKGDGSLDSQSYQLAGSYITALSGDAYAVGPGNANITLATVNGSVGTFGTATNVPTITVNEKGLVTNVTSTAINIPWPLLVYIGDVTGIGYPGTQVTLTLNSVNSTVINSNKIVKLTVNDKGLITSAIPANDLDIFSLIGYTPLNPTRTISINGVPQDLSVNRTWSVGTVTNVSATAGASIGVSVTDPTGSPNITITNLAPDRIVSITGGTGISVTGTYPNFTIINTGGSGGGGGTGTVTSVGLTMPSAFAVANSPITGGGVLTVTGVGNSGQYIDGLGALQTFPSISGISGFPLQSGNGGKYLTTNGSVLSWGVISQALSTLTDVSFPIALAQGQIITYNATLSKWENNTIGNALGYTPANNASVVHTTGNETVGGTKTFTSGIIETAGDNTFNTTSGNTFIGYSAPVTGGYKLDVSGTTRITGQLTLSGYTSTSVFTGTAVGYLAFDASGNIITSAGSGGGSSITLTTTGSSGAATLISNVLNIPNYTLAGLGGVSGSGTAGQVTYWSGTNAVTGSSNMTWNSSNGTLSITSIAANANSHFVGLSITSNNVTRMYFNSSATGANWNTGVTISASNTPKWTVAGYGATFDFTFYNEALAKDSIFIKGTTNNVAINNGANDNGYRLDINGAAATAGILRATGSITAATNLATGVVFTPTLVASANNDVMVGLDVNPTFTNGAFTGVSNLALRVNGTISGSRSTVGDMISFTGPNSTSFLVQASSTPAGSIWLNLSTNPSATATAGAYMTFAGYQEAWVNVLSRAASVNNKYFRFGNLGQSNYFAIQKLDDAGLNIIATPLTIFSTTGNVLLQGTGVSTTDLLARFSVAGSVSATSLIARGVYFNNTLVAAANNDVLVGLDIAPTFTNGAFTGVSNLALRVTGGASSFGSDVTISANNATNTLTSQNATSSTIFLGNASGSGTVAFELQSTSTRRFRILSTTTSTTFESSNQTGGFIFNKNGAFSGSITASTLLAYGVSISNTLVAAANNDVLVGLDITPTFTNGAFTGVTNLALRTTAGNVQFGGNTGFNWDNTNSILGIGTNAPNTAGVLHVNKSQNTLTSVFVTNNNAGVAAQAGIRVGLNPTNFATDYVSISILGSGYTTTGFLKAKSSLIEGFGSNFIFSNYNDTEPIIFATSTSRTAKMQIFAGGNVRIQNGGTFTDGNQRLQVIGDTLILSATSTGITTTTNVHTFAVSGIGAIHYDYYIQNTVNGGWRTGIVMAVTNGTNVEFTDTATADLTATTAGLTWSVSVVSTNIVLTATITSGTWNIKVGTRML